MKKDFIVLIGVLVLVLSLTFVLSLEKQVLKEKNVYLQEKEIIKENSYVEEIDFKEFKNFIENQVSNRVWVDLSYARFNVHIDQDYYNSNTPDIDNFFDLFEERFEVLEITTGWSAEKFYNKKLDIYVIETTGCYGGGGDFGDVLLRFSNPLYKSNCLKSGGLGGLGNKWPYMGVAMHETTHAINPFEISNRLWLREGFGKYNEYNILSLYGDISQSTADFLIFQGDSGYNWEDYVNNDYRDTHVVWNGTDWVPDYKEIQESEGYDITAWMFSMLRGDYGLNWQNFYDLMSNNYETLQKAGELGDYYVDMYIIDLFGRSLGLNFGDIQEVFRYDGPSGPGWGVRQWVDLGWYADLVPSLSSSSMVPLSDGTVELTAVVHNIGDVDLEDVSVRFYNGEIMIEPEYFIGVSGRGDYIMDVAFACDSGCNIRMVVDEDNLKIESNNLNNEAFFISPVWNQNNNNNF
ncbi:MAG: hypothetical protein KKF48_04160 [Nanoarchaeota archaeon]|nr:hypothetical protein [Nanoarchaeota archaeon]MBU1028213.1 hypothetical protein [Nanoarchaeota archaeon]